MLSFYVFTIRKDSVYLNCGSGQVLKTNFASYLCQSQKTQGFFVADFATLSDERRSRSKIFPLFIWIKEPCVRKFEGLERSKLLGISQTMYIQFAWTLVQICARLFLAPML